MKMALEEATSEINGTPISTIRYADDTLIVADYWITLQDNQTLIVHVKRIE